MRRGGEGAKRGREGRGGGRRGEEGELEGDILYWYHYSSAFSTYNF